MEELKLYYIITSHAKLITEQMEVVALLTARLEKNFSDDSPPPTVLGYLDKVRKKAVLQEQEKEKARFKKRACRIRQSRGREPQK